MIQRAGPLSDRHRRTTGRTLAGITGAVLVAVLVVQLASPASGSTQASLCDHAAAAAAARWKVPVDVLRAITLTETGRRADGQIKPWPWTVNMEGKGVWFDTPAAAQDYVDRHFSRGARSFDVGCFQINYRWHGRAFASIDEMFEPDANADYAARFLARLYAEFGDWSRAAGAYHSRTPGLAKRYRARFDRLRQVAAAAPLPQPVPAATGVGGSSRPQNMERRSKPDPQGSGFPLLQAAGAPIGLGSLVPLTGHSAARPLVPSG